MLSSKLPLFIAVVTGSVRCCCSWCSDRWDPVQAAAMNLLMIGASFGIVQAVFERGWLRNLFGAEPGPIDAFIPVRVFAIPFGLSMDYEVFLVSRIHEEWGARRDPTAAIRKGSPAPRA